MSYHQEILDFINSFNTDKSVEILFTEKCCYWFAKILEDRFYRYHPDLYYDPHMCHFMVRIFDNYYDIKGAIPADEYAILWEEYCEEHPMDALLVIKNCYHL